MSRCKECGSHAINPNHHGRNPDVMLDMCDVCYWRAVVQVLAKQLAHYSFTAEEWIAEAHEQASAEHVYGDSRPIPRRLDDE